MAEIPVAILATSVATAALFLMMLAGQVMRTMAKMKIVWVLSGMLGTCRAAAFAPMPRVVLPNRNRGQAISLQGAFAASGLDVMADSGRKASG